MEKLNSNLIFNLARAVTDFGMDHAIVKCDMEIDGKKTSIFVDPTNPSIGIYNSKTGRIEFLNATTKMYFLTSSYYAYWEGQDPLKVIGNMITPKTISYEEAIENIGIQKQIEALYVAYEKATQLNSDIIKPKYHGYTYSAETIDEINRTLLAYFDPNSVAINKEVVSRTNTEEDKQEEQDFGRKQNIASRNTRETDDYER